MDPKLKLNPVPDTMPSENFSEDNAKKHVASIWSRWSNNVQNAFIEIDTQVQELKGALHKLQSKHDLDLVNAKSELCREIESRLAKLQSELECLKLVVTALKERVYTISGIFSAVIAIVLQIIFKFIKL